MSFFKKLFPLVLVGLLAIGVTNAPAQAQNIGSGIVINDVGSGAPNFNAGVGSIWRRTDGASDHAMYVKEVGAGLAGWVGQ